MGNLPSEMGLSWLGVEVTSSSPWRFSTSHAQPEPNRVLAAFENSSLNLSKDPKVLSMASANAPLGLPPPFFFIDRKSTRLNSSHVAISYAVFCLKKKTRDQ